MIPFHLTARKGLFLRKEVENSITSLLFFFYNGKSSEGASFYVCSMELLWTSRLRLKNPVAC